MILNTDFVLSFLFSAQNFNPASRRGGFAGIVDQVDDQRLEKILFHKNQLRRDMQLQHNF